MDEVAEVKGRLEITEVVGSYVPLKQAGRNLKAPCPFHEEKSASFMVSPEKGIYHCFGCGEGGDIFNFVMKMEGMDFRQALEMLARKAGVELKVRGGDDGTAKKLRERLIEAHDWAIKYFQASLVQNAKALEYIIKKRRLNRETVKAFQIGYAPDSWGALTEFLVKKGFSHKELLQAGLAGQKEGKSTIYDLFRGRIMFTICDREGRPVGFTGRVLDDGIPKYLNTPQTQLYDKSQAIFGLHLAKEAIRSNNEVVLVEGNMDVIASHQAGTKQVVAASGTALTSQQLKTLNGLTKKVILAFDSDRAGLAATRKAVPLAQRFGIHLFALSITEAKDADELIQKDPQLWAEAIRTSKEIREYWLDRGIKEFDVNSSLGKKQFIERMIEIAELYATSYEQNETITFEINLDQDIFLSRVAEVAQIDISVLKNDLKKKYENKAKGLEQKAYAYDDSRDPTSNALASTSGPRASGPGSSSQESVVRRAVVQAAGKPTARAQLEESLLGLTLSHPLTRVSLDDLKAKHFSTPARAKVYEMLHEYKEVSGEELVEQMGDYAVYAKQLMLIGENEFSGLTEPSLHFESFSLARKVLLNANAALKKQLSRRIHEAEALGDKAQVAGLMAEFQEILQAEA